MSAKFFTFIPVFFLTILIVLTAPLVTSHRIISDATANQVVQPTVFVNPQNSTSDVITASFSSNIPSGNIVDLELLDSNNTKVWQKYETTGGTTFTETASLPNGTYQLQVGLFTPNWASNYAWFPNVTTINFPNGSVTPTPSQNPTVFISSLSNSSEKITVTFISPVPVGNIVDFELYNAANVKIWQATNTNGGSIFNVTSNQLPVGAYTVSIGLFTPNWESNYAWFDKIAKFSIGSVALTPTPTPTTQNTTQTIVSPIALTAYTDWKAKYVQGAGNGLRVVRPENSNDTVSEGMGYGMLLAVMANDATTFDSLWNYTKQYLDGKGLMNWQINSSGAVIGSGSATDADEDIAYALIQAQSKWPGKGYDVAAKAMIQGIANNEVNSAHIVSPGDNWGTTQMVNPSYIALGYYPAFASFSGDTRWNDIMNASSRFLSQAANPTTGLLPDWINTDLSPATFPSDEHVHDFWYDAVRTPIRLLQSYKANGNADAKALLQKQSNFLAQTTVQKLVSGYTLPGSALSTYLDASFLSAYTAAGQVDPGSSYAAAALQKLTLTPPTGYFGTSLRALALFFITGTH